MSILQNHDDIYTAPSLPVEFFSAWIIEHEQHINNA